MVELPPQPQVSFAVTEKGEIYETVGLLEFEDGEAYAIPPQPVGCRFILRLDKNKLEQRVGALGLTYFVHTGDPIPV